MNELHIFYQGVLRALDFSISGYHRLDEAVNHFFTTLCASPVFSGRRHLDFISYDYAPLKTIEPYELDTAGTTKRIFYNSFYERAFEPYMMQDYFAAKKWLERAIFLDQEVPIDGSESSSGSISTAAVASRLFINPTTYRVTATAGDHTVVRYDQHLDVLDFEVPFSALFTNENSCTLHEFRNQIFHRFDEAIKTKRPTTIKKDGSIYTIGEPGFVGDNEWLEWAACDELFRILKHKLELLNETSASEHRFFPGEIRLTREEEKAPTDQETRNASQARHVLDDFVKLIISQVASSLLFGCTIENIPAVVDVDERKGERRCLGNLVVGYREEISLDERAYLRIVSDRISAVMAAQAAYDLSLKKKREGMKLNQETVLRTFYVDVLRSGKSNDITHYDTENIVKDCHKQYMEEFFKKNTENSLNQIGLVDFKKHAENILQKGKCVEWGLITGLNAHADNLDSTQRFLDCQQIPKRLDFVNIAFCQLFKQEISKGNNPMMNSVTAQYKVDKYNGTSLFLTAKFKEPIYIKNLVDKLRDPRHTGNITTFLRRNYDAIFVIGNLIIHSGDRNQVLLDFMEDIRPESIGDKVLLHCVRKSITGEPFHELCYEIQYHD